MGDTRLIGRMELSSWRCRRSLFAAVRVIGGNLDQDHLDAIGFISAARGVTRQVNETARAVPPLGSGFNSAPIRARPGCGHSRHLSLAGQTMSHRTRVICAFLCLADTVDRSRTCRQSAWSPPHSHARRRVAMHAPCDQLRRALQQYSFPAITRNAEYERLPGQHRQHLGRHRLSLLLFGVPANDLIRAGCPSAFVSRGHRARLTGSMGSPLRG